MHKEEYENNEFKPYIFNLSLDNQIFIYPSYFNTSSFYIHIQDDHKSYNIPLDNYNNSITINNKTFYYIKTSTNYVENKCRNFPKFFKFKEFSPILSEDTRILYLIVLI